MNQPPKPSDGTASLPQSSQDSGQFFLSPHDIEQVILQRLQNHPSLRFSTLNVHRFDRDSICLEGYLESNEDDIDLCEVVRGIHGVRQVVNRVVTTHPAVPRKG